ncbi:MAG: DNA mismatch repair endonuclease MutL [Chloroflexi bacterium]|nr:DNA mismatch repair endonuclease MutL [Chloroflexota bacterium]
MPIRVLSPQMAARIAAGEVVERPASVVKELVENSLDAGATAISVEIRGGGLELIRVVDNGCGIPADEAELAFHRFATSKLSLEGDLDSITTLGFRGEALPSIAAVSTVSLVTRPASQPAGTLVDVARGEILRTAPQGTPPGTSVLVRDLFQNVPARLKFLKSPSAEAARVQTLLHQFALAFPEVRFHLDVDGRASFTSSGGGDLRDACAAIYGTKTARALLEVTSPGDGADSTGVQGLISPPDLSRASRSYIHLLVNRRWIQSRTLTFALEEAYQGFLMEGRHPLAVIHLALSPQEVDVNVHPAKLEVRFRQEREVFSALQRAVRSALVALAPVPTVRSNLTPSRPSTTSAYRGSLQGLQSQQAVSLFAPVESKDVSKTPRAIVPSLRVLGQVQSLYIVAEGPEGMYLVDQHAAHERVLYEKVQAGIRDRAPQVQGLLEPVVVELPAALEESLEAHREEWAGYGFDLEPFGPHSYLLRALPATLKDAEPGEAFLSILEEVGQKEDARDWEEKMATSIACHSAVRAGKTLSQEEMESLLAQLEASHQPNTCPHGRPTMVHLSAAHLQREFGRR